MQTETVPLQLTPYFNVLLLYLVTHVWIKFLLFRNTNFCTRATWNTSIKLTADRWRYASADANRCASVYAAITRSTAATSLIILPRGAFTPCLSEQRFYRKNIQCLWTETSLLMSPPPTPPRTLSLLSLSANYNFQPPLPEARFGLEQLLVIFYFFLV